MTTPEGAAARLYGREPLLRQLMPRMIGLRYDRRERLKREHRPDMPALLLTGPHGIGKTAVLDDLEQTYSGRIPVARHGFHRADAWARTTHGTTNTSPVVEMLAEAATSLAPGGLEYSRAVAFPRLLPGLIAVSCWRQGKPEQKDLAVTRLNRVFAACEPARGKGPFDYAVGQDLAGANTSDGAVVSAVDGLKVIARTLLDRYFRTYVPGKEGDPVREWYRKRDGHAQDGLDALVRLCPSFHRDGEFRKSAERTLVAAFLADVAASLGRLAELNRTPRPMLLLDDVHADGGDHALDLLLGNRTPARGGSPDPLVVVATRLGGDATQHYPDATRRRLPDVAATSGWRRRDDGSPSAGVLELPLPPLTVEDQLRMLETADGSLHPDLPSALHRLTAGNPSACRAFAEAVHHATTDDAEVRPEQLLALTGTDGRRVTQALLESLVPDQLVRRRLMRQCTAWDTRAADAVAGEQQVAAGPLSASAVRAHLIAEGWELREGPPFVTDRLLRELLTQELREASVAELGVDWAGLHAEFCRHHEGRAEAGELQVLRHRLSSGEEDAVASRLAEHFADWDAARWLECLRQVASAPHPPRAQWQERRRAKARGEHDRELTGAGPVGLSVNRLLHGLWYLSETTVEPTEQMCTAVGEELGFLSLHHPTGRAVLGAAAREWPHAVWHKTSLPVPGLT